MKILICIAIFAVAVIAYLVYEFRHAQRLDDDDENF